MNSDCLFVCGSEIPVGRHHRILFGCGNIYEKFLISQTVDKLHNLQYDEGGNHMAETRWAMHA